MIDKNDPEIQAYLKEELQKQKEQIAERILWRNAKALIVVQRMLIWSIILAFPERKLKKSQINAQWKVEN